MDEFDVIIVGGGIGGANLGAGIAAARRTLIIEAEDQCGFHSTGRSAAFYLESYGGAQVARLTRASGDFLERPPADFAKPDRRVQCAGVGVGRSYFQKHAFGAVPARAVQQPTHQVATQSPAARFKKPAAWLS